MSLKYKQNKEIPRRWYMYINFYFLLSKFQSIKTQQVKILMMLIKTTFINQYKVFLFYHDSLHSFQFVPVTQIYIYT